jgi:hypothetical protein
VNFRFFVEEAEAFDVVNGIDGAAATNGDGATLAR